MDIGTLTEVIWRTYQDGKPKGNEQQILKQDITQQVKVVLGGVIRIQYYDSKNKDEYRRPDYSFTSPLLNIKRFELSEATRTGQRVADMSAYDLFRLPYNAHFTNVYPFSENCGNDEVGQITQVCIGEENFYIGDPELSDFNFFVAKSRKLETYNIPPCVTHLDIETTYDVGDDTDISLELCYVIFSQVLGVNLKIKDIFDPLKFREEALKEQQLKG